MRLNDITTVVLMALNAISIRHVRKEGQSIEFVTVAIPQEQRLRKKLGKCSVPRCLLLGFKMHGYGLLPDLVNVFCPESQEIGRPIPPLCPK